MSSQTCSSKLYSLPELRLATMAFRSPPLFLKERPIKQQRAPHEGEIERLLFFLMKNAGSLTTDHSFERSKIFVRVTRRLNFHLIDDKIGQAHGTNFAASLATVCISYFNTNLMMIVSLDQNFPILLPNIYGGISLKLLITTGSCHLRATDDKGEVAINAKDLQNYSAYNSVLVLNHFATPAVTESFAKQQHQNLLACVGDPEVTKFSDVNAFRSCKVNALKSLSHLPLFSYSKTREYKTPEQSGVSKFRDLTKNDFNCSAVYSSKTERGRSHLNTMAALKVKKEYVLLPAASLLATVMFTAACRFPRFITKANYIYDYDTGRIVQGERDSTITSSFILFNSTGFIVSLAIVISILRSFPLKPWPQISVSMFFGSYMCLIMKILPWESWVVLFLSVPLLLLAAAGRLFNFAE